MYPVKSVVDGVIEYLETHRSGRAIDIAWWLSVHHVKPTASVSEVTVILDAHPKIRFNEGTQRYELKPK